MTAVSRAVIQSISPVAPGDDDRRRSFDVQRLRHGVRNFRQRDLQNRAIFQRVLALHPAEKHAQRRQRSRQRSRNGASLPAVARETRERFWRPAALDRQGTADVRDGVSESQGTGADRARRLRSVAGLWPRSLVKMRKPAGDRVAQIVAKRQFRVACQNIIERFSHTLCLNQCLQTLQASEFVNASLTCRTCCRYSTLPGFKIPLGSSAFLIARIMSSSTGDL